MASKRRSLRRWGAAGLATAIAAVVPIAASVGSAQAIEQDGEYILKVGVLQPVDNLNPFKGITAAAYETWALMYDTLTGYGQDFSAVPRLAESWEESEDGLTWTYHLVDNATFSDGEPLTADDVVYTFDRIIKGESIEKTNYGSYVKNMESVKAIDDTTVEFTLSEPTPIMTKLAVPILPEHIWSEIDADELREYTNEPDSNPPGGVGSGPFVLDEAVKGQYWTFKVNPDYWDGAPKIDGVEYRVYRDANGMVTALKNGEIDFADDIDANLFATLENQPDIETNAAEYYGWSYITFNGGAALTDGTPIGTGHPSLKDPIVRQAIHLAVDKQALIDVNLEGYGSPGSSFMPPIYADQHYEPENPIGYDPELANQMLDEAGYTKGPDGIRTMPDGSNPLDFQLYSRSSSKTSQTTIELLQGWLEEIGIDSTAETVSESRLYAIAGEGTFDMYEWGWVTEPDPDYQASTFTCGQFSYETSGGQIYGGLNDSFYCNEEYDELYEQQAVETDPEARTEIVKQLQQMVYEANAYIIPYYYDYLQAWRTDRFTGFEHQPEPDGAVLFQYGTFSYLNVEPVTESSGGSSDSDSNTALVIGGVAAAAVLVGAVVYLVSRGRRSGESDVE